MGKMQYEKLKQLKNGCGWFNATVATMAMNPLSAGYEVLELLTAGEQDVTLKQAADEAFKNLPKQMAVLEETGAAKQSRKGRYVIQLPIGQLAWKRGYDFRTAKPYLCVWLDGSKVYEVTA